MANELKRKKHVKNRKNGSDLGEFLVKQGVSLLKTTLKHSIGKKPQTRRNFSESVKKVILLLQNNRCKSCKQVLDEVDFHHIDRNSSNNVITNCEALCPNCHARKSRRKS